MTKSIYIVEDNEKLCKLFEDYFDGKYIINFSTTGEYSKIELEYLEVDIVILDLEIGNISGFDLINEIKQVYNGPIIFISGKGEVENRIKGLQLGAEDFIPKPFNFEELELKIDNIIKRFYDAEILQIGEYEINEKKQLIFKNGKRLKLSKYPYLLFVYLLKNSNNTVTRDKIFREIWNGDFEYSSRLIDTNISYIRKQTLDYNIKSVRGKGYVYRLDPEQICD